MTSKPQLTDDILESAALLWDYMRMRQPLAQCDVAIAMGSHDVRVAEYAAQLVLDGWAPLLVCSGAVGRLTQGIWQESEARRFAQAAQHTGLEPERIILEERSTNTAENLIFSAALLEERAIPHHRVLLVHKPYMERRVWATAVKVWPQTAVIVSSPPIAMREYATESIPLEEVIAILAGDFQRVMEYPSRGYAASQEIPKNVLLAFHRLTAGGFTSHLL